MYTTRRSGFDRDDARLHYAQLQTRKMKGLPRVGDKAVLSDHKDAQVYTISEVYQASCGTRFIAQLTYVNDAGMLCKAGGVDCSSLLLPSDEQLNAS